MVSVGSLAFELGERQEHVEHQPAHRVGRVELLSYAYECNLMTFEDFEHASEVHQRTAQSIDFVDDHAVDLPSFDVRQ